MTVPELVVIGTSLGGLSALEILLGSLPDDLELPIAIVQHRPVRSDDALRLVLQVHCARPVCEPDDKEPIEPNRVYLAPPDYHLLVARGHFALSTEPRVRHARPSIDVLFDSAAHAYGAGVIGVALTGASKDGAAGLATIKAQGGYAIVQSPGTAESAVLPNAAIAATKVDKVLTLPEIAPFLASYCAQRARAARASSRPPSIHPGPPPDVKLAAPEAAVEDRMTPIPRSDGPVSSGRHGQRKGGRRHPR